MYDEKDDETSLNTYTQIQDYVILMRNVLSSLFLELIASSTENNVSLTE